MGTQAEDIIARLMRAFDVHDEATLAIKLGRDMSTIRVWKSRDQVPLLVLSEASRATGFSVGWLRGEAGADESAAVKVPDDNRMSLSSREHELVERYRATSEEGRAAVEVVAESLASPQAKGRKGAAGKPPLVGMHPPQGGSVAAVLQAREGAVPWRDEPVKGHTIATGDVANAGFAGLLPIDKPGESRPLVLSIMVGDAGRKTDYEVIPKFLAPAGAGAVGGAAMVASPLPEGLDQVGDMAFGFSWLRDNLGHTSGQLASIKVHGDSMAGTLIDGETIIIDTSISRVDVSGIYVITINGDRLVKRIDRKLDDSLVIISDNKVYPAEKVPAARVSAIRVLGRMVWPRSR